MRIKCKGYWSPSTPDSPAEFDCEYENSGSFGCDDCIINGGSMSPISGKVFRGNRAPYEQAFQESREKREHPKYTWRRHLMGRFTRKD